MADLLSIGLSGLTASKTSLSVTGHNITNVNTPGFSRQDTVQSTRIPQFTGSGFVGTGTTLTDVRRTYNEFLTTQVRSSTALSSDVEAYKSQISQLDSLLAGSSTGLTAGMQNFFSALQTAAEDPANIPARQLVLSEAEGFSKRFNTVYDRLAEQNDFVNKELSAVSDQVNELAGSIAGYNKAIASASVNGSPPNDLLDAREEAVRQLSTYIGVTVVQQENSYNLFVGSGQPLVVGNTANSIEVGIGTNDPNRAEVTFVSGGSRQGITSQISGGAMGGLLRYREEVLDSSLNTVGRLALSVADQVNSQLGQGLDLKGNVGASLYGDFNAKDLAQLRVLASSSNTGSAQPALEITDTSALTTSDYQLTFDGTSYAARRSSDGADIAVTVTANPSPSTSSTLSFADAKGKDQGFQVVLEEPATGDKFTLQPTRRGASSISTVLDQPDQLAFAAPMRSEANLQNSGTGVIGQPELTSSNDPLLPSVLSSFSPVTMTYNATTKKLDLSLPSSAPASVVISPATPAVISGQSNTLSYSLDVTSGTPAVTETYTFEQRFSGRPEAGDTFTLAFNSGGVSDNRNALKLADLQSKASIGVDPGSATSGASFTDSYGALVERVGTLTSQARTDSEATGAILKQASDNRDSVSAVNLDEEAAKLIQFEQYYQASAQIIQVARTLFDTLLSTLR